MLGSIRKFSTSIYAKILLGIVIIPFVFWGMGSAFTSGSKNIVVIIDKEKYSTQNFINFIQKNTKGEEKISSSLIEELLSIFIGEKLIEKEIEYFKIKLSDEALGKIIKSQKEFQRDNKFSRTEYEKYLLKNNFTAASFEASLSKFEKKRQLLDFIGGGIFPSKFIVNKSYDQLNQKRKVEFIDLNTFFNQNLNFSEEQINKFYNKNKNSYEQIFKTVNVLELNPKILTGEEEYNDNFFNMIDEIDDLIFQGNEIKLIKDKYNLKNFNTYNINKFGKDKNANVVKNIPEDLIKYIFNLDSSQKLSLIEKQNKYFVVEVSKTENILRDINNKDIRDNVIFNLENETKSILIYEMIKKTKTNNFSKSDFYKFSKEKNIPIKKTTIENQRDNKIFNDYFTKQIYKLSEKSVTVIHDLRLTQNFLVFVDKVEKTYVDENTDEYKKFSNLSKIKLTNELFNTYDNYIKKKYEIEINYKTLDTIKNYFN